MTDLELAGTIRDYVAREVQPLRDRIIVLETSLKERESRIAALESREIVRGERGEQGPKGDPGQDGVGERGERGEKGDKGDQGTPGAAGVKGDKGETGERGETGATGERGQAGERGADGAKGERGERGDAGQQGERGADGKTPTREELTELAEAAVSARSSEWALDFERRAQDILQRAVDKLRQPADGQNGADGVPGRDGRDGVDGKDGAPGRDALDLDDLTISDDGDGLVAFTFKRGSTEKRFEIRIPRFRDRGVFSADTQYRAGDGISHQGAFWLAQKDNPTGKPGSSDDWRLAVKKARDGRDGNKGDKGDKGDPGQDLRYN